MTEAVTAQLWAAGDANVTLANASLYLEVFGHIVIAGSICLEQALAAEGKSGDFYDGKRAATQYSLPLGVAQVDAQLDLLASSIAPPSTCRTNGFDERPFDPCEPTDLRRHPGFRQDMDGAQD
ncbi:acyl-CoA dehydrogenase C-terminal domain-containing protein [Dokdonella sp.]|uniref:acyl-CoA dehydrogenase C-terminal domain-containing protein n=1 Tax=Dokdonella sp. TaxID=2291710 RepID=UPI003529A97E